MTRYLLLFCVLCLLGCEKAEGPRSFEEASLNRTLKDEELLKWQEVLQEESYRSQLLGYGNPFKATLGKSEVEGAGTSPLERWELGELKLTGILEVGKRRFALFEDPTGKGHLAAEGARIGKKLGYIAAITKKCVRVVERAVNPLGEVTEKEVKICLKTGGF